MLPQLATLYFVARHFGYKRSNTRNKVFQLTVQQILRDKLKKNVARITGSLKRLLADARNDMQFLRQCREFYK